MFALFEGLGSQIYPNDFQDVEVKDEALEPDTVSCKHFQARRFHRWSRLPVLK